MARVQSIDATLADIDRIMAHGSGAAADDGFDGPPSPTRATALPADPVADAVAEVAAALQRHDWVAALAVALGGVAAKAPECAHGYFAAGAALLRAQRPAEAAAQFAVADEMLAIAATVANVGSARHARAAAWWRLLLPAIEAAAPHAALSPQSPTGGYRTAPAASLDSVALDAVRAWHAEAAAAVRLRAAAEETLRHVDPRAAAAAAAADEDSDPPCATRATVARTTRPRSVPESPTTPMSPASPTLIPVAVPAADGRWVSHRWQVTFPADTWTNRLTFVAVALSFVPWVLFFGAVGAVAVVPCAQSVSHAVFLLTLVHVNEKAVKPRVVQPRPATSLLTTSGMPSSHTLLAYGSAAVLTRYAYGGRPALLGPVGVAFVWATYLPVAWARVRVGDHSPLQVAAGATMGLLLAQVHGWFESAILPLVGVTV